MIIQDNYSYIRDENNCIINVNEDEYIQALERKNKQSKMEQLENEIGFVKIQNETILSELSKLYEMLKEK